MNLRMAVEATEAPLIEEVRQMAQQRIDQASGPATDLVSRPGRLVTASGALRWRTKPAPVDGAGPINVNAPRRPGEPTYWDVRKR
jgi:hypothetical protein